MVFMFFLNSKLILQCRLNNEIENLEPTRAFRRLTGVKYYGKFVIIPVIMQRGQILLNQKNRDPADERMVELQNCCLLPKELEWNIGQAHDSVKYQQTGITREIIFIN